ncbi:hypothetical protein MW887_006199 [Aspergillus wentii]|nr:hypothetical protein MW887_006199 [Aspergillus wentii]
MQESGRPERVIRAIKERSDKASHLAARISRIEELVTQGLLRESVSAGSPGGSERNFVPSATPPSYPQALPPGPPLGPPSQPPVSSSVALHFAGREFGVISLITGIPFLLPEGQQWIESRTGQRVNNDKLSLSRPPWEKQRAQSSNALLMDLQPKELLELPDQTVVRMHFEVYRSSLMQRVFPVLDSFLFHETIKTAYQPPQSEDYYGHHSARACIFAFIAFASILHQPAIEGTRLPPIDSDAYTLRARYLVPQILQETPTLDGLQTVTILALIELILGNLRSADYFGSLSARFIFMLGAHTNPTESLKPTASFAEFLKARTKRHLRNIFWLCYSIEKDVAIRTGQPLVLSDENCDITLPPGYEDNLYTTMAFHHHSQQVPDSPLFPVDLRLSIIKSRAYSALYSFKALQKSDAEILKEIRELDDELERWRLSVPLEWRPTLSFSHETPDPNLSMHSVMLRLNYHLCMMIIHQASSRCKAWDKNQSGMREGVSSSLALSVEASRSTLLYLETAEPVLLDGVFWAIIFYPMSALLAIFCNILQNPSDPQATKDLALLKTATGVMERVFLRETASSNEVVHIKLVADFVNELYRLAICAVEKAYNERYG